jgi:uncharacterized protein (DUF924 family)
MNSSDADIESIIQFWLRDADADTTLANAQRKRWYRGGVELDDEIRAQFGELVNKARADNLRAWQSTPRGALAVVILLDQFTRNLFRGTPDAYSGDQLALNVATATVDAGRHTELSTHGQIFLFHPFHHSERIALQDRGVQLMKELRDNVDGSWREFMEQRVRGFSGHRDIVAEYGRFPHRNAILARETTAAETAFLAAGADNFGQRKPA